ncbi:MAG: hypothetical protein Phog2KO_30790 [Phototrophicaceae bacterium]
MLIKAQYKREHEQLQIFLGEIGALLERPSGFVQRKSKIGDNELIQTLTLGCLVCQTASKP